MTSHSVLNKAPDANKGIRHYRYKSPEATEIPEDPTSDYMNVFSMIFSMCGLMMRIKWCAWLALCCSFVSFANLKSMDDTKQLVSSFMLSVSSVIMCYLQNPQPMNLPWSSS